MGAQPAQLASQLISEEERAAAFRLVCLEMIKAGITCYSAGAGLLREGYESGLRAFNALLITNGVGDYRSILQNIQENYSDRFQFGLGPWVPLIPEYTLLEVKEVAERHDLKIHMHVAENMAEIQEIKRRYGCRGSIEYLDKLGLLSPRLVAFHCVHIPQRDIQLMKRRRVSVVHCPASNAKLGDGIALLVSYLRSEIPLGLGTDGPATNNCIDLFQEMKFACLLQRAVHCNPAVIKAEDVLRMSTTSGAKLLGKDHELGSLEVGKKADLIIVDLEKPHLYPRTNLLSHLVYSAKASDVDTTVVDGKIIMRKRRVKTMNESDVLREAQEAYEALCSRIHSVYDLVND